ncbi:MAG: helix-turn-helix transcriptional regulator [Aquisalinus sp.]|nr:helix-turn-helix transcriptional regulator [Aquisalinus sp.]
MAKGDNLDMSRHSVSVLEPLDALEIAMAASSIDKAWEEIQPRLASAGFENCALAVARRSIEAPVGHPDTRFWGTFVSDRFLIEMAANPDVQRLSPPLQMLRRSARPIALFGDEVRVKESDENGRTYNKMMKEYGIVGRAIAPFHAPAADCMMAVGWWDFNDAVRAQAHWEEAGGAFCLAATYFCQGILDAFNPLEHPVEKLSVREKECLLWAALGRRTGEIADLLGLADTTVNEYLNRAMKKLGAKTRSEACTRAVISGILKP